MASAIDATKPTAVAALTADVRGNFSAAKTEIEALQTGKQDALVSGTSIKTVNSTSLLGSGNVAVGDFKSDGTVAMTGAIATTVGTMTSSVANGAAAVGFNRNTTNTFSTAGAIIDRVQNNGTTVFAVTNGGSASLGPAVVVPAGVLNSPGLSFGISNIANFGAAGFYATGFGLVYGGSSVAKLALTDTGFSLGTSGKILWSSSTPDTSTWDVALGRNSAGVLEVNSQTAGTFRDLKLRNEIMTGVFATSAAAPTIASAGTIAPTTTIAFVSGTTTISTITAPSPISAGGGQITLIPTGLWVTNTAGNIALATTAVVSKALTMTYDVTTAKWYPSY